MILIVGGSGYIGSHLIKKLTEDKKEILCFDNFENGHVEVLDKLGCEYIKGDLRNPQDLIKLNDYDIHECIHFAAYASVGESMQEPYKYYENNTIGTLNLLNYLISNHKNFNKFVFSSTSEVYGDSKYLPIDEKHHLNPINPYGMSKLLSENLIKSYSNTNGISYVILRYFNAAGCSIDGQIGELHEPEMHLIPNIIFDVLGKKEFNLTCSKVDTKDGTPIRDYVHVEDLADAHILALDYMDDGKSNVFNLGSGEGYSVLEIVNKVEELTGKEINKSIGDVRAGEPAAKYASNEKAKSELGWNPKYGLDEIVESALNYFKSF